MSDPLNIYVQMAQIGAALVSVITAIMVAKVMEHLRDHRGERDIIQQELLGTASRFQNLRQAIPDLVKFAQKSSDDSTEALSKGQAHSDAEHMRNLAGNSSGSFTIDNRNNIKQCKRTISNCSVYTSAIPQLVGRFNPAAIPPYINELQDASKKVTKMAAADFNLPSNILNQDEESIILGLKEALENATERVQSYRKRLYAQSIIALIIATVLSTILCVSIPLLFTLNATTDDSARLLVVIMLFGSFIFASYSAYLLVEVTRLHSFYWSKGR